MPLVTFSAGQVIRSADVNTNFGICVLCDTSRTVTVTHTYTASQTFSGGWTAGAGCTISTGGFTVTAGGITVSAGTTAVQALTATTGSFSGTVTSTVAGLILGRSGASTTVQYLDIANTTGRIVFGVEGSAGAQIITGTTGYSAAFGTVGTNNLYLGTNQAIAVTIDGSTQKVTLSGTLQMSTAASKLVPGATSFSHRNNADSADNLLIADNGSITLRNTLALTGSQVIQINGNNVVGPRAAGWATQTTAQSRADMGGAPTLATTYQTLAALVMDLRGHGLI